MVMSWVVPEGIVWSPEVGPDARIRKLYWVLLNRGKPGENPGETGDRGNRGQTGRFLEMVRTFLTPSIGEKVTDAFS